MPELSRGDGARNTPQWSTPAFLVICLWWASPASPVNRGLGWYSRMRYNACLVPETYLKCLVGGQHSTFLSNNYASLPTSSGGRNPSLPCSPFLTSMYIFQKDYIQSGWPLDVIPAWHGSSDQKENTCCCLKASSAKGQMLVYVTYNCSSPKHLYCISVTNGCVVWVPCHL